MKRYRIYTEDVDRWKMMDIVGEFFSGFTVFIGMGVWQGNTEKSVVFEIVAPDAPEVRANITEICKRIKIMNEQECVMVTVEPVELRLI